MVIKQIIYMVLSLIVLVVIIGVPLYDYANTQIFGGKGIKKWLTEEKKPFVPYKGELDTEEQKVHNSLSALVCATNVVASTKDGKFVYDEKNCPGAVASTDLAKCQGVLYGESCVVCERKDNFVNCRVKDFELPQKIDTTAETSSIGYLGYLSPLNWISAYGDPKYVVYYEAFPQEEADAWILDEKEVSLAMIATLDIALPVGGVFLKSGGKFVKRGVELFTDSKLAKAGTLFSKTTGIYYAYKLAATTGRTLIKKPIELLASEVKTLIKSGIEVGEKGVIKLVNPEVYVKIFSSSESILKYAKPEDIKKLFGGKIDELAEAVRKGEEKEFIDGFEVLFQEDVKLSLAKTSFLDKLKDVPASIKPLIQKSGINALTYSAAIVLAKEDSMRGKFASIGVNTIGFKKPYNEALLTGGVLPGLNENANNYYLALNKEGYIQQRFFLASPCRTNLKITTQKCLCAKNDVVEEIMDGRFLANKFSLEENNHEFAVKECFKGQRTGMESRELFESKFKSVDCISIEPQDIEGFCYSGSHWLVSAAAWTFYGTSFATSVGAQALKAALIGGGTATAGPAGFLAGLGASAGLGAIQSGLDYSLALLESWATSYTKWPNH